MSNAKDTAHRLRLDRNKQLIKRMRSGETLTTFSSFSSWFPPRPMIEKDPEAVAKLYGEDGQKMRSGLKDQIEKDGPTTTVEYGDITEAERIESQIRLVDENTVAAESTKKDKDAQVIQFPGS